MPNEGKKKIVVKTKVKYNDTDLFSEEPVQEVVQETKLAGKAEPVVAEESSVTAHPKHKVTELHMEDFDYSDTSWDEEEEWDEEKEAAMEAALNEEFDRTYEGYDKKKPIYKRWWFWVLCGLLALVLVFFVLRGTGSIESLGRNEPSSVSATVTEALYETIEAKDLVEPNGAELRKVDGRWGLYLGDDLLTSYNGIARNDKGTWYVNYGYVDFDYTGYLSVNGQTYMVNGGKVDTSAPVASNGNTVTVATASKTEGEGTTAVFNAAEPVSADSSNGTRSQQDALAVAVDYINQMAFSKEWLTAQIVSEGYSEEDARWAVEHCGANWNEQAVKKAQEYLQLTTFSKDDMVTQLEFEGFTHEQAVYGAEKAGL